MPVKLLIIAHTPSPNTQNLVKLGLEAINSAIAKGTLSNIEVELASPFDLTAADIQQPHGIILFTTENFGYMSGALKDMFDRTYIDCLENTQGKPYGLVVRAGTDGTGTILSVNKILTGLKWHAAQKPLLLSGTHDENNAKAFEESITEYMLTMAAGVDNGIF